MDANLRKAALEYHEHGRPGKISVTPTKQLTNQRDLALAYSPGVAAACEEIVADPANVFRYTARGNLVGVITNGTAVLGLDVYKRQRRPYAAISVSRWAASCCYASKPARHPARRAAPAAWHCGATT